MTRAARAYAAGSAEGLALVLREPLSLWGGFDLATGRIIDRAHPDAGACVTGTILVMSAGRGSSSSSAVLAEAVRRGSGPAGIVLATPDPILTVGSIVAASLYGLECPVIVCPLDGLRTGVQLRVSASGDGQARLTMTDEQERE